MKSYKNMKRVNLIVWIDGCECWNRVYLDTDGQLYIKTGAKYTDVDLLSNHHIDRTYTFD